ncbi:Chloramphenicol phosphotransferase-like protein [Actinobacillus pleuropneumoniae]|nr:Chloramphenicol phosphotransferase-like protein [Actinobacillus pleuropneumoniae]
MSKGKIVYLNGVTSSGKTSIVDAIQLKSDEFFYVVANDLFENTIGDNYLREDYWKYLSDAIIMMYHTAKLFSDHGKNVLIDGILVERPELKPHYEKLRTYLLGTPFILLKCFVLWKFAAKEILNVEIELKINQTGKTK